MLSSASSKRTASQNHQKSYGTSTFPDSWKGSVVFDEAIHLVYSKVHVANNPINMPFSDCKSSALEDGKDRIKEDKSKQVI